ncbi:hypothetical protein GWD52_21280 [Enterobacteriaceae bacterium 4M9]|nr:hypothetical protein [Enterobacteriaceae bacterium 4M9]
MATGTISLTKNSDTVIGAGTSFSSEIKNGDFIVADVGGLSYTLAVKTVSGNTSIVLVNKYTGPTMAGRAFEVVTQNAMSMLTAAIVVQNTEALRGLNYDKRNWQQLFTATGNITVTLPDNSSWTGPAWGAITSSLAAKMDKIQNLNDVENKATARNNLGLTLISSTTDETAGRVMTTGAAGLLARSTPLIAGSYNRYPSGFYRSGGGAGNVGYGAGIYCSYDDTICFHIHVQGNGQLHYRYLNAGLITYDHTVYSTGNTTKSSDGTLKAASPVARIVKSQAETERADINEDEFEWCGAGTANAEAAGIEITRQDVGVYVITGAAGLAEDGWRLLPPRDPNGSGDLGIVEAEGIDSGITVRLYKRRWQLTDDGDIEPVKGPLIDVPVNSWIDVRLSMPLVNE